MAFSQFLNPQGEDFNDDWDAIIDEIAKAYSKGKRAYETEEEDVVIPKVGQILSGFHA